MRTALFLILVTLASCTDNFYYESELLVRVEGLLSGKPREGIIVQVFETLEDAEYLINPLSPAVTTDFYGEILFAGLIPDYDYFIRVDGVVFSKIRRTGNLRQGQNAMTIKLL